MAPSKCSQMALIFFAAPGFEVCTKVAKIARRIRLQSSLPSNGSCNLRFFHVRGAPSTGGSGPVRRSFAWGMIPWLNRLDRRNRNALEMFVDSLRFPIKVMHSDRLLR